MFFIAPLRADDEDFNTQLMRATVKVGHEKSTGTGFILTRPDPAAPKRVQYVLITAAHVFERMTGDEATLSFRKKEAEGVFKKESQTIAVRAAGKPAWTQHPSEDVAVMVVTPPAGVDLPALSVDLLATDDTLARFKVHPGDTVSCLGYPHRVEANDAGFPVLRTGAIAGYPLTPTKVTKTFLLSINSFEGDSGGPVYLADPNRATAGPGKREDARLILGLIVSQQFLDEELKTIYGTTKVRHRLGLAAAVHAAYVRETVNRVR
ncbi:hypothetical protein FRUB_02440 [Fimbriiglobus ruber]|uniref:Serine protease n=1 Tax=Fimbriiglobus ruber TaxID=1908690 RepID=A0A225E124_9BACT|nr:hypothetical protein FRUB_02440 [Fimbriiglobus ruber]